MKHSRAAIGTALVTSTLTSITMLAVNPAVAAPTLSEPVADGLAAPLQFEVDRNRIIVGQTVEQEAGPPNGLLTRVRADGTKKNLHTEVGGEVAGVAVTGDDIAFLTTGFSEEPSAALKIWKGPGDVDTVADLQAFEENNNPDADFAYGFRGLDKECAEQVPEEMGGGYPYAGIVESHPYALATAPGGGWYVADAAANAILKVSKQGAVSVVDVLAPRRLVVTEEMTEGPNGAPECTIGKTYAFESVPTDVEVNRKGKLIVSLLPGGPEDPSLGARGAVVRVDPVTGKESTIATGLFAATNVAIGSKGRIFVTELFGDRISRIKDGVVKKHVDATLPAGLEWANGQLYASIEIFGPPPPNGKIVTVTSGEGES